MKVYFVIEKGVYNAEKHIQEFILRAMFTNAREARKYQAQQSRKHKNRLFYTLTKEVKEDIRLPSINVEFTNLNK